MPDDAKDILRESEEKFRNSFDYTPIGMALVSTEGRWLKVNEALLSMLGYSEKELMSLTFQDITHPEDLDSDLELQDKLLKEELSHYQMEKRYFHKNGNVIYVLLSVSLVHGQDGKPAYTIKQVQDITIQKKISDSLREREEFFKNTFDYAPIGMAIVAPDGHWIKVNSSLCTIIGYTQNELISKTFQDITHPDDLEADLDFHRQLVNGEINFFQMEKRYFHKNGSLIWILLSVTLVRNSDGSPLYFIKQVQNITDKKNIQLELEDKNKKLEESNNELEHFAYIASHDLQVPLHTISRYSGFINDEFKTKLDPDITYYFEKIAMAAKQMSGLIESILDYSKVGKNELSRVNLNEVMNKLMINLKAAIHENNAVIVFDDLPVINAEPTQMLQLFQNLIINAIRYRRDDDPVINISAAEHPEEWLFSVSDNGIGIDERYYEKIFVIFQRLNGREKTGGTGIGLTTCKKIVELHNGKIWVKSEVGKGSTFYFTIRKKQEG